MRAVLLLLSLQACYTVRFVSPELHGIPDGAVLHTWTHSFLWGIIPAGKASIDQCGYAGVKEIKSQIGGLGLVASVLTLGVWTPMHVQIVCAEVPRRVDADPFDPALPVM
ncbi:MAG TPA: hypothetical protein PKA64_05760 [Myxococcota bacterium]|nr:hypothetical protein [Myxococcota bacterium]